MRYIPTLPILILSFCFPLLLLSQTVSKEDSSRSKLAGINAHMSRFGSYMESHSEALYHEVFLVDSLLERYLSDLPLPGHEEEIISLSPEDSLTLDYMNSDLFAELKGLLDVSAPNKNTQVAGTSATLYLNDGRVALQLYNGDALLLPGKGPLKAIKDLRVWPGPEDHVHWSLPLDSKQTEAWLASQPQLIELPLQARPDSGLTYELPGRQVLFHDTLQNKGFLYADLHSMLEAEKLIILYETEGVKWLTNQLVDGELPEALFARVFQLNKQQLKQVQLLHQAMPQKKLYTDDNKTYLLADGSLLCHNGTYGYARIFPDQAALQTYRQQQGNALVPSILYQELLRSQGDSLLLKQTLQPSLGSLLGIEAEALDGSEKSMQLIQEVMQWKKAQLSMKKLAIPLLLYVGESLKKQHGGAWQVQFDEERKQWEALIVNEKEEKQVDVIARCLSIWPAY
jgi:hypothetical protein